MVVVDVDVDVEVLVEVDVLVDVDVDVDVGTKQMPLAQWPIDWHVVPSGMTAPLKHIELKQTPTP